MKQSQIIVALDMPLLEEATEVILELAPLGAEFKVGLQAISAGWAREAALRIIRNGGSVGWDGKFADIPNTVGEAVKEVAKLGVRWANVHASIPFKSILAAVKERGNVKIYGVTVLTSMTPEECEEEVFMRPPAQTVKDFALRLAKAGAQGIICSPQELPELSVMQELSHMDLVTPGIRPLWSRMDDQERVTPPAFAAENGATYQVVGRPIVQANRYGKTRAEAFNLIAEEIASAS